MSCDKLHVKKYTETPSTFSCLVRTATVESSDSNRQRLVETHLTSTPQSLTPDPSSLSPTPSTNTRNRARRNTISYKRCENEVSEEIREACTKIEAFGKSSLSPPKILRRSSAPHLNMKEISTLSRAGISTTNLLNFITVSDSLEKINKD